MEQNSRNTNSSEFMINLLKGRIGQVIVEAVFQKFGYEVYPYGYENRFTNIVKFTTAKKANTTITKLRATPDLIVYDAESNNGAFVEVKSTTRDATKFGIGKSVLETYRSHWPESILVVYCIPSGKIYCCPIEDIDTENLDVSTFPNSDTKYVVNLEEDFQCLSEHFSLIEQEMFEEFQERIQKEVLEQYSTNLESLVSA